MHKVAEETKFEKKAVIAEYRKDFQLSESIVKMKAPKERLEDKFKLHKELPVELKGHGIDHTINLKQFKDKFKKQEAPVAI